MRYLYEVDWRDPLLYDLAINTERLDEPAAVALIVRTLGQPEYAATPDSLRMASDLALAAQVRAALAANADIGWTSLQITAREGIITVGGAVRTDTQRARVLDIARAVPGVRQVEEDLGVLPPIPWG